MIQLVSKHKLVFGHPSIQQQRVVEEEEGEEEDVVAAAAVSWFSGSHSSGRITQGYEA